jgi:hypothetical protein
MLRYTLCPIRTAMSSPGLSPGSSCYAALFLLRRARFRNGLIP